MNGVPTQKSHLLENCFPTPVEFLKVCYKPRWEKGYRRSPPPHPLIVSVHKYDAIRFISVLVPKHSNLDPVKTTGVWLEKQAIITPMLKSAYEGGEC